MHLREDEDEWEEEDEDEEELLLTEGDRARGLADGESERLCACTWGVRKECDSKLINGYAHMHMQSNLRYGLALIIRHIEKRG